MIGIEVFHRTSNINFHSSSHCWMPLLPAEETNAIPPLWHHFLNDQSASWCQVDYIGLLPIQCFVLVGIDITLGRYLPSMLVVHLPNNYIFNGYLFHSILHSITRTKKLIPQQIKYSNAPVTMEFTGLIMPSILLKQLSWWNNMSLWNLSYVPARYELKNKHYLKTKEGLCNFRRKVVWLFSLVISIVISCQLEAWLCHYLYFGTTSKYDLRRYLWFPMLNYISQNPFPCISPLREGQNGSCR